MWGEGDDRASAVQRLLCLDLTLKVSRIVGKGRESGRKAPERKERGHILLWELPMQGDA